MPLDVLLFRIIIPAGLELSVLCTPPLKYPALKKFAKGYAHFLLYPFIYIPTGATKLTLQLDALEVIFFPSYVGWVVQITPRFV